MFQRNGNEMPAKLLLFLFCCIFKLLLLIIEKTGFTDQSFKRINVATKA